MSVTLSESLIHLIHNIDDIFLNQILDIVEENTDMIHELSVGDATIRWYSPTQK